MDLIQYIQKILIKSITNNVSFFIMCSILILGVGALLYARYQSFLSERIELSKDPKQIKQCGRRFDFHDELILNRFRGGIIVDPYFRLTTQDQHNFYFHYYPGDLERLGLDQFKFPLYGDVCVYYSAKQLDLASYPIITRLTIQP